MRIIAGKLKGSSLYMPRDKNTRPLKDLARESIFNLLTHSNKISLQLEQSNVLDLYAGTGSFGLECLSRQAKMVCFIEKKKDAIKILEKNIEKLKVKNKVKIFFNDIFEVIKKKNISESKFDIIFCDPPFKETNMEKLIKLILNKNLLNKNGIIILHRNKAVKEKLPNYFKIVDERIYGISKKGFLRRPSRGSLSSISTIALLAQPSPYGFVTSRSICRIFGVYTERIAARISGFFGAQSKTLSAFNRPNCLSPTLIVAVFRVGASMRPLEELPMTQSTCLKQDKYLSCPNDAKTLTFSLESANSFIFL